MKEKEIKNERLLTQNSTYDASAGNLENTSKKGKGIVKQRGQRKRQRTYLIEDITILLTYERVTYYYIQC